jgi:tRNA_anti-like
MKKKNIIIACVMLFFLTAGSVAWYIFNKPHRSLSDATSIIISADSLLAAYLRDEKLANLTYLDKALTINGEISELTTNQSGETVIILKTEDPMAGVVCTLQGKPVRTLQKGQQIKVKGFCSGYISDVVLRDCLLIDEK